MTVRDDRTAVDLDEPAMLWPAGLDGLCMLDVPLAPEIRLQLATDPTVLWARMEAEAGRPLTYPFWSCAWLGGQALARFVLDHPEQASGLRVLDFAAGSGVAGIAAKLAGAAVVTANDIDPYAIEAIKENAKANGVEIAANGVSLLAEDVDVDLVLAGDVFYSRPMAEMVLPFLQRASRAGARILVGDSGRRDLPRSRFDVLASYPTAHAAAALDAEVEWVHVLELAQP